MLVAVRHLAKLALHMPDRRRQVPVLEGCAIPEGTGLASQNRNVVQRVVDGLVAPEGSGVLSHDLAVLSELDPLGISSDFDRSTNGAAINGVAVLVEPGETRLGHRGRHCMEPVEGADVGNQALTLSLELVPVRPVPEFLMGVGLRPGHTAILEPCIEFGVAPELRARHEEPSPHHTDLVLDLALLPARGRGACHRIDKIVPIHLLEAPAVGAVATDADRVHRRFHVVVDAPRAGSTEEGKGLVVSIEDHLLRLAWIGPHEEHPAVAKPDVRHLHRGRRTIDHHHLVAPVELVSFPRIEAQWHIGGGCRLFLLGPRSRLSPNRVIATIISFPRPDPGS